MSTSYAKHFSTLATPQAEQIPGTNQVQNSAGGYVFEVTPWTRLQRFLILGNEGGTYYASEKKLTIENAQCVTRCLNDDPLRTVKEIVDISHGGRAPKNDPAIFALAIAAGHKDPIARREAEAVLPHVCRIPTHLFQFVDAVTNFRRWGHGLRRAISAWYENKSAEDLAFAVGKYQSRDGWNHSRVLRLAHPKRTDDGHDAVYRWILDDTFGMATRQVNRSGVIKEYPPLLAGALPSFLAAVDEAKTADKARTIRLILDSGLPRECVMTERLNEPEVWDALLQKMPLQAMVRNLGKMTAVGLLKPMSAAVKTVTSRLADQEYIHKSRLHPIAILLAGSVYGQGHGDKGKLSWDAVPQIKDAMDEAFYLAFANVEPTNKRTLIGLDVSGSMAEGGIAGTRLTPREGAAALACVTARTEPNYAIMAFSDQFMPLDITPKMALRDVLAKTANLPFSGTDCSLPMVWAMEQKIPIDVFQVITDSETWANPLMHPCQALVQYRQKMGIGAKLVVLGMTATNFSIADKGDSGSMDVVGFDSAVPQVIADFVRG